MGGAGRTQPADKELLVRAMVTVIGHDGKMTVAELELLRTICAMLHCPLSPLVEPSWMVTQG